MINWGIVQQAHGALEKLAPADREAWLATLAQTDPDSAEILAGIMAHADDLAGFMATRASDAPPGGDHRFTAAQRDRIGPWRLESPVGRGGMGEVWLARRDDGVYDQTAALKLLAVDRPGLRDRFAQERQRLARLEHPHIARIIDGGEDASGNPYMVMEYVEGERIDRWCELSRVDRKRRVGLLIDLCEGLAHAHARLVLHLDIKSANVLVNDQGAVRLIDFGIAALMSSDGVAGAARPGRALTLLTAAPEQLAGGILSAATDIFQVGLLSYLLLTGALPERQADGAVRIDPTRLVDPDLVAILNRACAVDPAMRYASADALGDDLRNWKAGLPVTARNGGALYRTAKALRRYPVAFGLAALLLFSLIGGITVSLSLLREAEDARDLSEFYLAEARRDNQLAGVWADLMQRAFGNSGDQDRLAQFLMEYSETAHAAAAEQPEEAAMIASAIGMHFMFRNDYPRTIAALEPWMAGGYGSDAFRFKGSGMLARAFMDTGREADAVQLLRGLIPLHERRHDAYQASHAATASQLALLTKDSADIAYAKTVLSKTRELHSETAPAGYLENQLALLYRLEGDFAKTQEWLEKSLTAEAAQLGTVTNNDTGLINITRLELATGAPLQQVEARLAAIDKILTAKGESASTAHRAALQAEIDLLRGDNSAALASIERAVAGYRKFTGAGAPGLIKAQFRQAEILARNGRMDAARSLYRSISLDGLTGFNRTAMTVWQKMADLAITRAGGNPPETPWRPSAAQLGELCINPDMLAQYARLEAEGLALPVPCLDRLSPRS